MKEAEPHGSGWHGSSPRPATFRRSLVFVVAVEMVALVLYASLKAYALILSGPSASMFVFLAIDIWGAFYAAYLSVAFFLIGLLDLPGCEFVAVGHVLFGKRVHRCVDSVLNAVLDSLEDKIGLDWRLLGTESAKKWLSGSILFALFLALGASNILGFHSGPLAVGAFATVYLLYDKTIHRVSIDQQWLTGSGDYTKLLLGFLRGKYR